MTEENNKINRNLATQAEISLEEVVRLISGSENSDFNRFMRVLPSTVYILDAEKLSIEYVNRDVKEITGVEFQLGVHFLELMEKIVHKDDLRKIKISVLRQKELEPGNFYNTHYRIKTINGDVWVQDRSTLFVNQSDGKRLVIGIVVDITSLMKDVLQTRKSERTLKKNARFKDKFLSIITHDIRGAFSGYLNMSELLARNVGDLSVREIRELANELHISADNLFKLLDNLMDWSKIQRDNVDFLPVTVDLGELAEINVELYKPLANSKKIKLINSIPKETYSLVDFNFTNTLFRNLLSNSIKFTNENGMVGISLINTGERFHVLKFEDNGIGIDESILDKLFNSDEIVTTIGTMNEPGTGLGLAVVKDIVKKSGGRFHIESKPGVGTSFLIYLPVTTV